jgi:hypothetical protein
MDSTQILSPSDTLIYVEVWPKKQQLWLDTLLSMSVSTDMSMNPVWNLGENSVAGHTLGNLIVAGSLVFPKTSGATFEHVLAKARRGFPLSEDRLSKIKPVNDLRVVQEHELASGALFDIYTISMSELEDPSNGVPMTVFSDVRIMQSDEQSQSGNTISAVAYKYMARNMFHRSTMGNEISYESSGSTSSYLERRIKAIMG